MLSIAEAVYASLGNDRLDADMIIAKVQPHNDNLRLMVMSEDNATFVVAFDDGSVLQFHFMEDSVKIDVGYDMQHTPRGAKLS